jgi:hypothetical protein
MKLLVHCAGVVAAAGVMAMLVGLFARLPLFFRRDSDDVRNFKSKRNLKGKEAERQWGPESPGFVVDHLEPEAPDEPRPFEG